MSKIKTRPATKESRDNWKRAFKKKKEKNLYKCPNCKKVVDYGEGRPIGRSYCSATGKHVKMRKVKK